MGDGRGWRRAGSVAAVVLAGVLLTGAMAAAQVGPNFEGSKRGPTFAEQGDVITYTIEVRNTGDPVRGAELRDEAPSFTTLVGCTYEYRGTEYSCMGPPGPLWTREFSTAEQVVTELAVRVNIGTLNYPLTNEATLTWAGVDWTLGPVTTVVNPRQVYLPVMVRNAGS